MSKTFKLGLTFLTLSCLLPLSGCFNKKVETITLLVTQDSRPYSFRDSHSEEILGFEIELMKHISKKLGKTLQIKPAEFASLFADIEGANADAAVGNISPTPERIKIYDFSIPYASAELVLVSRKDKGISSVEDLFGKVLAVQSGSVCEEAAKKISEQVFGVIVKPLQNNDVLLEELSTDGADALIMDSLTATHLCNENEALLIASTISQDLLPVGSNAIAIMLPKDSNLREKINTAILEMQKDGSLETLEETWLKETSHEEKPQEPSKEEKSN